MILVVISLIMYMTFMNNTPIYAIAVFVAQLDLTNNRVKTALHLLSFQTPIIYHSKI